MPLIRARDTQSRTSTHSHYRDHEDSIIRVTSDEEFEETIRTLGLGRVVVVYFSLPWCGSCQKANAAVQGLSNKYSDVIFLNVNAEKLQNTTKKHKILRVPVFLLFNNRNKVDRVEGAAMTELEMKIRRQVADLSNRHYEKTYSPGPSTFQPQALQQPKRSAILRMADVTPFLDKTQCRCINDLVPTPFQAFLEGKKLVSGKGSGRMILVYAFREKMVITSLKIKAPVYSGPRVMRFFANLSKVLDFSLVSQMSSTNEIVLNESDLMGNHVVDIQPGGLLDIQNLQIYIPETMSTNRKTEIDSLILLGAPMSMTTFANNSPTYESDAFAQQNQGYEQRAPAEQYQTRPGPSRRGKATDRYLYQN